MGRTDDVLETGRQVDRLNRLIATHRDMVTSTDLDGLLTSGLLMLMSDWQLVGFFDSKDSLWISSSDTLQPDRHVFVDVHLSHPDWISIDQHIVAVDRQDAVRLIQTENKINPNLARMTVFEDTEGRGFTSKYPFATFHYVLALLEAAGFMVPLDLSCPIAPGLTVMDLALRADGAAENTRKYARNAADWWTWLRDLGGPLTSEIAEAAAAVASSSEGFEVAKRRLEQLFRGLGCSTSDANFADALKSDPASPQAIVAEVFRWIGLPREVKVGPLRRSIGKHIRVPPTSTQRKSLSEREDLFTYAFTSTRTGGFSATLFDVAAESQPDADGQ